MAFWTEEYPHELHANVLLLDNKIECWKVSNMKSEDDYWSFKAHWKPERFKVENVNGFSVFNMGDYAVKTKTWIVNNSQEHSDVFNIHATEWFKQWEHADDYCLGRAY